MSLFASVQGLEPTQVKALESLQEEFNSIETALEEEQNQLLRKYEQKRRPLYSKRKEAVKKIPGFWKTVFEHHPMTMQMLDADDVEILEKMTDMSYEESVDGKHQTLTMTFDKNPFFTNATLRKEVTVKKAKEDEEEDDVEVKHSNIEWAKGKKRKAEDEGVGFFSGWYQDDEEAELLQYIKSDLLPRALKYFAGYVESDDEEVYDDEPEGDESEDIEESEEEKPNPSKKSKKN